MKRRFFLVAFVLVLALGGWAEAASFSDIDGHWAKDYIEWTAANNIFTGYEDGTFKPDKKITRSEYVTIISKFKGLDNYPDTLNYYDVKADDWFYVYLNDLVNTGLLKNDTTFQGQSLITRDEAFGLLGQLFPNYTPTSNLTFNDNASIKRAKDILVLKDMGIIQGDDYNYLNPTKPLSRAEAATILYKLNVKGIYVNKAELAQAKEKRLLSFDFNAVPIDENFNEELAGEMNQAVDQLKAMMGITSAGNNIPQKVPTKEELESAEHAKMVAEAKASPDFVATYEEAKEKIKNTIINREESVKLTFDESIYMGTDKSFRNVFYDIAQDDLFMLGVKQKGGYTGPYESEYIFDYEISNEEADSYRRTIEDIVRAVEYKSDYEKAKYIHDWIVNNTSYAHEQYMSGNYQMGNGITAYDILSIFKYGKGVCQAYAETFHLIAREAGLKSRIISGDAYNSYGWGGHAWNLVEIDGKLYHIDTTWDDLTRDDGTEKIRYRYFLIDDRTMGEDHKWDESKYPSANSGCLNDGLHKEYRYDNEGNNNNYYNRYR